MTSKRNQPEYYAFMNAKYRCTNPAHKNWDRYGARGITFLFTSFEQFFAEVGPRPSPEHSLDRIRNDGHYEPGNVKWSTMVEQQNNIDLEARGKKISKSKSLQRLRKQAA